MRRSRKILVVLLVLGFVGFGYSQYASASQMGVTVIQSELVGADDSRADYNLELRFDNPSLLYLTSGKTEFVVSADEESIGYGTLDPFTLAALSTTHVEGKFQTHKQIAESDGMPAVRISGVTQYDLALTSVDVPFVFYPTEEQAKGFIRRG